MEILLSGEVRFLFLGGRGMGWVKGEFRIQEPEARSQNGGWSIPDAGCRMVDGAKFGTRVGENLTRWGRFLGVRLVFSGPWRCNKGNSLQIAH